MHKNSSSTLISQWIAKITSVKLAVSVVCFLIFITYGALPLIVYVDFQIDSFLDLSVLSLIGTLFIWCGSKIGLIDSLVDSRRRKIFINIKFFNALIWFSFSLFVLIAWITAPQIPLIAALSGANPDQLAVLREEFLKARGGWAASLVYVSAALTGALIPYSLALMFLNKLQFRWLAAGLFLVYCISFLEKAYFFKLAIPIIYLVAQGKIQIKTSPSQLVAYCCLILFGVTFFSGAGSLGSSGDDRFFSVAHIPQGPLSLLAWRTFAIPLITAADALRVFYDDYQGKLLWGATSSLIAGIFGMERIAYEREVFAAQWGQNETGTGSANSVYVTEAFVNFGFAGLIVFSLLIGLLLRLFMKSKNEAFRATWPLFAMGIYTSGLIGMLFSNGFLILFFSVVLFKFQINKASLNHRLNK